LIASLPGVGSSNLSGRVTSQFECPQRYDLALENVDPKKAVGDRAMAKQRPAITAYGDRHEAAPAELDLFSFLIGKWEGSGRTRLADGTLAEYDGLSWIGRCMLDGGKTWNRGSIEFTMNRVE
jgi:hypothetical protein